MLTAVATFVLCLAIIGGIYWVFIVRPEEAAGRAVRRRLVAEPIERTPRTDLAKAPPAVGLVHALDSLLGRSGTLMGPLRDTVRLSNLPVTPVGVLIGAAVAGLVAFVAIAALTGSVWFAALGAVLGAPIPYTYVRFVAQRRLRTLEEQFPQAIDLIAVSMRAGHSFPTGLLMVAEEVAEPLGAEFRMLHDQQNYGKPLPDVLKDFAARVPLLDVRIFVTAVLTQRETGGNLAEVLDKLSALIRQRFTIKRQVRVVSAHGRITGWVLALMPPAVAAVLALAAPQHLATLVEDPIGAQLIAAAVALQITGMLAIRRIVNIEI